MNDPVELKKIEDEAGQRWEASAGLRAEFAEKSHYVALCKAEAQGRVRTLGQGAAAKTNQPRG